MTTKSFSKGEAVRLGWETMKKNIGFFIALLLVTWLVSVIPQWLSEWTRERAWVVSILASVVSMGVSIVIAMGLIRIALRFCDNQKGSFADFATGLPLFWKYLAGAILYGLIVLGGLILLIVPGLIWGVKFQFFGYLIVDKGLGPVEALKKSSALTQGVKWNVFVFDLLLVGVTLLGLLALIVGLFAAVPTAMVAMAAVYRKLLSQTEGPSKIS